MSTAITFNGVGYTVPAVGETSWGNNVSNYLIAIASGCLQKSGGTFTLTAEVDFGATYSIKGAYFKTRTANPAGAGLLRLARTDVVSWRNQANSANLDLAVNASNQLTFNSLIVPSIASSLSPSSVVLTDASSNLVTSATLARSLVATGTADHVLINNGSGAMSSEASLAITRGGTGQATASAAFDALAPTTTNGDVIVRSGGTNTRLAVGSSGQVLKVVGTAPTWSSFSGGVNYISANPDAEGGTAGYATYADAAQSTPVNGTGGSASITFTQSSSSPLRGTYNFLITKDAANRQGEGVSYDFTIDRADLAQPLMVSFDYEAGGSFVGGDSSDVRVFLYDVTNSTLIYPSAYTLQAGVGVEAKYIGYFQTDATSTSYRLIWHVATTNASAWTLKLDNVYLGPDSNAIPFSPVSARYRMQSGVTSDASTPINYDTKVIDTNAAVTTGAGVWKFTAPIAGIYQVAASGYSSATGATLRVYKNGTLYAPLATFTTALYNAGTTLIQLVPGDYVDIRTDVSSALTVDSAAGYPNSVNIDLVQSLGIGAPGKVVAATAAGTTTGGSGADSIIIFGTTVTDTAGAYNATTGRYTVPVYGLYQINASINGSNSVNINIFKNGTKVALAGVVPAGQGRVGGAILCNPGDIIDLRTSANIGAWSGSDLSTLQIALVQGPSAVAYGQDIVASYYSTSISVANSAFETLDPATKSVDTNAAYSAGVFTVPVAGNYLVTGSVNFAGLTVNTGQVLMHPYKNGSAISGHGVSNSIGNATEEGIAGSWVIPAVPGDLLRVEIYQSNGATRTANSATVSFTKL